MATYDKPGYEVERHHLSAQFCGCTGGEAAACWPGSGQRR